MLKQILRRARRRSVNAPIDQQVQELLRGYRDEIEEGRWSAGPETYERALTMLVEDARDEGRRIAAAGMAEGWAEGCACACRQHGRNGCPLCLHVEHCPTHAEPDPRTLHPGVLRDPEALGREMFGVVLEVSGVAFDHDEGMEIRAALIEACRRCVCARAK